MLQASVQLYRNAYSGLTRQMWWLAFVMFVNRSGTMVIPFLTVYLTSRGFTLAQAGYVMAAFGCGAITGSILGGRLTDRIGFHYVQFLSLLLNGLMFIVLSTMHTFWQFVVCIFVLSSLGESFRPANAAAIAAYSEDHNRTRSYSLNRLAINLGWSIGPAVGGILAGYNYTLLFWADGITCMLASFLLLLFLKPGNHPAPKKEEGPAVQVNSAYRDKVFLQGMFFYFLVGFVFFQLFSLTPVFYKTVIHLSEAQIGLILAMNGIIISLVEMVLVYKLENWRNPILYIVSGSLLIGSFYLMLSASRTYLLIICSMLVFTVGEMLLFPFINNFWVRRSSLQNRGQYAAVYTLSFSAAQVVAPTLAAMLANKYGFSPLWILDFVICAIAAGGFYFLKRSFT
jgi:predicted MFS family arabinose efflux permease